MGQDIFDRFSNQKQSSLELKSKLSLPMFIVARDLLESASKSEAYHHPRFNVTIIKNTYNLQEISIQSSSISKS